MDRFQVIPLVNVCPDCSRGFPSFGHISNAYPYGRETPLLYSFSCQGICGCWWCLGCSRTHLYKYQDRCNVPIKSWLVSHRFDQSIVLVRIIVESEKSSRMVTFWGSKSFFEATRIFQNSLKHESFSLSAGFEYNKQQFITHWARST